VVYSQQRGSNSFGGNSGLVRLVGIKLSEKNKKDALVAINDAGDHRVSCYRVPAEEVDIR
jgi:hypothetical protein